MGQAQVWVNGLPAAQVEALDRGFQYGDGLFETFLLQRGVPLFWQAHLERLRLGCIRLKLPLPNLDLLRREVEQACRAGEGVLKLIVSRGLGARGYAPPKVPEPTRVVSLHPLPSRLAEIQCGVKARFCRTCLGINPALAGIKHLNRLEQVLARAEWDNPSVYEGLMCDSEGFVVEGTMSNLFWRRGKKLFTPKLDRCGVRGIVRDWVIARALAWGFAVEKVRARPWVLAEAEEIFLTNSVIGVVPVVALAEQRFAVGPLAEKLKACWQQTLAEAVW